MNKILTFFVSFLLVASSTWAGVAQFDGRKTVATAGTAEALTANNIYCSEVTICAEADNTGVIAVGVSPVAALATREGVFLNAEDCYTVTVRMARNTVNLASIQVDTTVNGDGVTYHCLEER